MTNYNLQIQKILLEVDKAANLDDKMMLLKQAISLADANNDLDWGYDLRMDLIYQEKGTSHCIESIQAFTWILNTVDANPDLFEDSKILLEYKWMVAAAHRNANFTMEQIDAIRTDFKRRMIANGHGSYTYNVLMLQWCMQIDELVKARQYQEERNTEQPDSVSFCHACVVNSDAELELYSDNIEKAISVADNLFSKRDTCKYEPFNTLSVFAYYFAKHEDGRGEEYYQKTEEELINMDSESYMLINISYLIFCASLYQKDRAWELFEKYSEWSINAEDYYTFYFATNILPLLKEKTLKKLSLNSALPYFSENGEYDTSVLYNYFYAKAQDLASKFDARNNNTFFADTLKSINSL